MKSRRKFLKEFGIYFNLPMMDKSHHKICRNCAYWEKPYVFDDKGLCTNILTLNKFIIVISPGDDQEETMIAFKISGDFCCMNFSRDKQKRFIGSPWFK